VPVIDALTVSVAVTVHVPVLSVTENTPCPLVSVLLPGSVAVPLVEVMCTVPV
jgi:hypothetical protein